MIGNGGEELRENVLEDEEVGGVGYMGEWVVDVYGVARHYFQKAEIESMAKEIQAHADEQNMSLPDLVEQTSMSDPATVAVVEEYSSEDGVTLDDYEDRLPARIGAVVLEEVAHAEADYVHNGRLEVEGQPEPLSEYAEWLPLPEDMMEFVADDRLRIAGRGPIVSIAATFVEGHPDLTAAEYTAVERTPMEDTLFDNLAEYVRE